MARIRTVKPEFFSSPGVARLDPRARLLFIALWILADDEGRGSAQPRELLGFAFPFDEEVTSGPVSAHCADSAPNVRQMCEALSAHVGVIFYEVEGRPYFQVSNWAKHQKIDNRRSSRLPGPEHATRRLYQQKHRESAQCADSAPEVRRDDGATSAPEQGNRGTGEQGNRGTGEQSVVTYSSTPPGENDDDAPAAHAPDDTPDVIDGELIPEPPAPPDRFDEFWRDYPARKNVTSKAKCRTAWTKATKTAPAPAILDGLHHLNDAINRGWQARDFTPNPTKWLNEQRWENRYTHDDRPRSRREIERDTYTRALLAPTGTEPRQEDPPW